MIERRAEHHPMAQPVCGWCRCFPCQCSRSKPCSCGGTVTVDGGFVAVGVRAHNASPEHAAWRASRYNGTVGISDASPDIMCDALLVADTSREGVPRLEVSAPMTTDVR